MSQQLITLVYQHDDFYLVDKPAGVGFHDEDVNGQREQGFFNFCSQSFGEVLYPVHRLDKLTSGLLLLARNKHAAVWFQKAFEQRRIEKLYVAISDRKPKKKQGSIIGDMEKARSSAWKLTKGKNNPAVTRFFSWGLDAEIKGLRSFLIKPETGKTHQIRVALKSIGAPILGDGLYGGSESDRGYLHAYGLKFLYLEDEFCFYQAPTIGDWFPLTFGQAAEPLRQGFSLQWPASKK